MVRGPFFIVIRELLRVGTRADARGRLMCQTRMNRPGGSAWAVRVTTVRVCSMRLTRAGYLDSKPLGVVHVCYVAVKKLFGCRSFWGGRKRPDTNDTQRLGTFRHQREGRSREA
jgi:hypothetical protein